MKKLHFSIEINAPREKAWNILWNDITYRDWTSIFQEGSYAVSDWKEGSKILFLSPEGSGMYSRIARKIPNEFMSFEHLGEVKEGEELEAWKAPEGWAGAMENYKLESAGTGTKLDVELDTTNEFAEMFGEIFPKALKRVKALCE